MHEIIERNYTKVGNWAFNNNPNNMRVVLPRKYRRLRKNRTQIIDGTVVSPLRKKTEEREDTQMSVPLLKMKRAIYQKKAMQQ